jgi:hypothetical protein
MATNGSSGESGGGIRRNDGSKKKRKGRLAWDLGQKWQRAEVVENQVEVFVAMMGASKSGRGARPGILGRNGNEWK